MDIEPILKIEALNMGYHSKSGYSPAVKGVDLALQKGEVLGLVGESGCGKSSLAFTIMGLLPRNGVVQSGRILFNGIDLLQLSPKDLRTMRWNRIAMVFQSAMNSFNPMQTIGNQIIEAIQIHDAAISKRSCRQRVGQLLEMVGLTAANGSQYPHQLSGGMRQRALIAMALACEPELMIADEPTTALDTIVQKQVLSELQRLQHEKGLSMIYVSHDMSVIAEVSDRVAVMYAGEIVETNEAVELFDHPSHDYTKLLLSSRFLLS